MKKTLALLLAGILTAGMTACNSNTPSSSVPSSSSSSEAQAEIVEIDFWHAMGGATENVVGLSVGGIIDLLGRK